MSNYFITFLLPMITIVFCHPLTQSFNHQILDAVTKTLSDEGREYAVINLYGENFNPVLDSNEISHHNGNDSIDPKAKHYAEILSKTQKIIFIFPIWWGEMPAMLKGFIYKTFIKGIVYDTTPEGSIMPCLTVDSTTIITTSDADSELFGNYIMGYLAPMTLTAVGMNSIKWYNLDHISQKTDADRARFIDEITSQVAK